MHKQKTKSVERRQYKYSSFLCMLYLTALLIAVVLGYRIIGIRGSIETGSTFIFPFTYFFGDIIAEVYGYQLARRLIWWSLACEFLFVMSINIINALPVFNTGFNQEIYNVLSPLLIRVFVVSFVATLISELLNVYIVSKTKILLKGNWFSLRVLFATGIAFLLYANIASFIAFVGKMPVVDILNMAFSSYLYGQIVALILIFPATLLVKILKRLEKVDHYDHGVNFNPFKLT